MASANMDDNCSKGFTCFWKIENFILCKERKRFCLKSQILNIKTLNCSKWYLEIREIRGTLNIFLYKDAPLGYHIIDFSMTILTNTGWLPSIKFSKIEFHARREGYGCNNLIKWKNLFDYNDTYLPRNSLTICCHIWNGNINPKSEQYLLTSQMISEKNMQHFKIQKFMSLKMNDFVNISNDTELATSKFPTSKKENDQIKHQSTQTHETVKNDLLGDMDDLLFFFDKMNFSYVTLRTANKDYVVQKAIICAKSPVFSAMFDTDMKEKQKNIVNIDDIDNETLSLLIQFLHHEPLDYLDWNAAVNLYYAAEKYQVEQLKNKCTSFLKKNLTPDNIYDALVLTDIHQNLDLDEFAKEYFCKNSKKTLCSTEWKKFLFENTALAAEVLKSESL